MAIDLIADYFGFRENNTNLRIETLAGVTTFMTMSYIIFVQPVILGSGGRDKGAVMVATCISSVLATILMVIAKKSKKIHLLLYIIMVLFLARYILT